MRVVFVHGACVRDGTWWWSRVDRLLAAAGLPSEAVPLPSCGETGRAPGSDGPGLDEDIAEVRRVLAQGEPAILVGHSYGGVVITEAAEPAGVAHLVYITSFLPEVGEALADFGGEEPAPYLDFAPDGTFTVRPELTADLFLHDCDPAAREGALARLTRQSVHGTRQPVRRAAWHEIPSTYLLCTKDRGTPPTVQHAQAVRADRVVELPSGHHPFLSHPDLVARDLLRL